MRWSGLRDYKLYLYDIKEAIEKIESFTKDFTYEEFVQDVKTIDAVIRNLGIIGEAAKHISKRFQQKHSDIDWTAIIGMRNIIVHEYFGVKLEIIWKTVKDRLPGLGKKFASILKEET